MKNSKLSEQIIASCFTISCLLTLILVSCESEEIEPQSIDKVKIDINKKANGPDRITICHYDEDNESWMLLDVNERSWEDHNAHGDLRLDDQDSDGYVPNNECEYVPEGMAMGDCDDLNAAVNPKIGDIPGDGIDNDCDGIIDEGPEICQDYEGGIVFYLVPDGEEIDLNGDGNPDNGLIAAPEDINVEGNAYFEWGCYEVFIGATNRGIGGGWQNTQDIINAGCVTENGGPVAAEVAVGYGEGWFLPSEFELKEMTNSIGSIQTFGIGASCSTGCGGLVDGELYWSSSAGVNSFLEGPEGEPKKTAYSDWNQCVAPELLCCTYRYEELLVRPVKAF